MLRKTDGFTFVEMLVVITIIGILATLALPRLWAVRSGSELAAVKSDTKCRSGGGSILHGDYGVYGS